MWSLLTHHFSTPQGVHLLQLQPPTLVSIIDLLFPFQMCYAVRWARNARQAAAC